MSSPVVLITGALTGIGRATAIAFAKEGARLVVPAAARTPASNSRPSCARLALLNVDGGKSH